MHKSMEREYKYLLIKRQYSSLWNKMRPVSEQHLQDNLFFDYQSILGSLLWALRLRIEGPVATSITGPDELKSLYDAKLQADYAVMAMKGPARMSKGAVLRAEEEAEIPLAAAMRIAETGCLRINDLPQNMRRVIEEALKDAKSPEEFTEFAFFRNLRLLQHADTPRGGVEVALDRSETRDGRSRYELEVETTGDGDVLARQMMRDLGVKSLKPAKVGKLVWAAKLDSHKGMI